MRLLVTGGAGFIGSAVVRRAIHTSEDQVLVVDKLTYAGNLENLASVADHPRYGRASSQEPPARVRKWPTTLL